MPKRYKRAMRGGEILASMGVNSARALQQINTANRNIRSLDRLETAKPPLQAPGNLAQPIQGKGQCSCIRKSGRRHRGGALRDKYGAYLYIPNYM